MTAAPSTLPVDFAAGDLRHDVFTTHYLEAGSGPPVLLIHGSGPGVSAQANWQGLLRSDLIAGHRVLAPDVVGFGATQIAADVELSHDVRVEHLVGFLDAMQLARVDVVGNSMGGGLALALAHRYPERIRRMVLMGTVGVSFDITPALDAIWGYTPSRDNMAALMPLFAYDQTLITDALIDLRHEASSVPTVHERYAAAFAAPRQRHVEAMALTSAQLATISAPTLLIHGRDDQVIPFQKTSLRLLELLPNADLVVLGRCGHWTQIERAADFTQLVDGFFAN